MSKVYADNFPRSISQYVPNMEHAADVINGVHIVSLGAPDTLDANGIWAAVAAVGTAGSFDSDDFATTFDGSATSTTTTPGMLSATYGQCLTCTGSGGSNHVIVITGRDYLGQRMSEQFTLSGALIIYGNKAFKFVDSMTVAAGASGDTVDVGWYDKLGLPYKAESMIGLTEDNVRRGVHQVQLPYWVNGTDFAAGTDLFLTSPVDGFVVGVNTTVSVQTSGEHTTTIKLATTLIVGLSLVIATASAVGVQDSSAPTDIEAETNLVAQYDDIEIEFDGTPSAGAITGVITINPVNFAAGVATDPQTATTIDPRGTIQPYTACDESVVFEVRYTVDTSDLHGVEQYSA